MCSARDDDASGTRTDRSALRSLAFPAVSAAAAAVESMRSLAEVDPADLSPDERLGVLDAIEAVDRMLAATTMRHLVAVDDRAELDARFGMTPGAYSEQRHGKQRLNWMGSIRKGRTLLRDLPEVFAALRSGRISVDRAELFANVTNPRNAEVLAAAQSALLDLSDSEPRYREFAHHLRTLAAIADPDGKEPDADRATAKVTRSGDHLAILMHTYGNDAVAVDQVIAVAVAALRRRWVADVERCPELKMPTPAALREQAIVELILRGAGADPAASKPTVTKLNLVLDADRVEELDPLLAAALSPMGFRGQTVADGPGLEVENPHHHVGPSRSCSAGCDHRHSGHEVAPGGSSCVGCGAHHELPRRFRGQQIVVSTPDGDRITLSAQQFQLLLCDADISETLLDAVGEPLAVRDRDRLAGPRMRTALIARDGGCAFPGCDAPTGWCDAHHVVEYSKDGRTIIINLVLLCRHHHGIVHRRGWRMERSPNPGAVAGFFVITTADGLRLSTQHRARPARGDDPPGRPPDEHREPVPA